MNRNFSINNSDYVEISHISTINAEEDFKVMKWPSAEFAYTATFTRLLNQGDKAPYPLPRIKLQVEDMLQHVQAFTGLSNMGPNSFYEPLSHLIQSINAEAKLSSIYTLLRYVIKYYFTQPRYGQSHHSSGYLEEIGKQTIPLQIHPNNTTNITTQDRTTSLHLGTLLQWNNTTASVVDQS